MANRYGMRPKRLKRRLAITSPRGAPVFWKKPARLGSLAGVTVA
jgi:hypothetical protein